MASIKDLISSLKKTKDKAISDNEGWFRGGKFTPGKQISEFKVGNNPTLGEAFNKVTSQGLNKAFNPYPRYAEDTKNNAFVRTGADIVNQGLKNYISGSTFNLIQPKMGEAQTTAGKVTGGITNLVGAFSSPASKIVFGAPEKLATNVTRKILMTKAPQLAGTKLIKILPGITSEAAQTLSYAGLSKAASKLGLNERKDQFSPKGLASDFAMGVGFRTAPNIIQNIFNLRQTGNMHPEDVTWTDAAVDVIRNKKATAKAKENATTILYNLAEKYIKSDQRPDNANPLLIAKQLQNIAGNATGGGQSPVLGIVDNSKNADEVSELIAKRSKLTKLAEQTPDAKNVTKAIAGIDERLSKLNLKINKAGKVKIINPRASSEATVPNKPVIKLTESGEPKIKIKGFVGSVQDSDVGQQTKNLTQGTYKVKPNTELMGEAKALLTEGGSIKDVKSVKNIDAKIGAAIQEALNLDAMGKHDEAAALFNNLSDMGTELGRGVQSFSLLNKMSPEAISLSAAGKIKQYNRTHKAQIPNLTGEQQKMISDQVETYLKMADGIDKNIALQRINETINSFIPSSLIDKGITVWKAGLLTSLRTHERNLLGNTIMQGSEIAKDVPGSWADYLMSLKTGQRTVMPATGGTLSGAKQGLEEAGQTLKYGFNPNETLEKFDTKKITWNNNPLEQLLKKYTDTVFDTLAVEDKPFWQASYNRSLYQQSKVTANNQGKVDEKAILKLFNNPTEDMKILAIKDADYATFHDKSLLSNFATNMKRSLSKSELGKLVGEVTMPFTGVPTSVAGKTIDYSPIGLVKGANDFRKVMINDMPELQRQAAQELGRGTIGTALFALGGYLMSKGLMTGQPKDAKEAEQWKLEGKQANSILIDGKWRSINSIGPQSLVMLAGAKYNEEMGIDGDGFGTYGMGLFKDQLSQTFLSGVQQPLQAITDPKRYAGGYVGGQVSSLIPNIVKDTSKAFDQTAREVDTGSFGGNIKTSIQQNIPLWRNQMPPRRDVLGNPIAQEPTGLGAYFDLFNSKTPISNTVVDELARLNNEGYNASPSKLTKNQTISGVKMTLDQKDLDYYEQEAGKAVSRDLEALITSPVYQKLDDSDKKDMIDKQVTKTRKQVRAELDLIGMPDMGYKTSADAPRGIVEKAGVYGKSLITDPKQTIKAVIDGNPIRKVEGGIVILERKNALGSLDKGDQATEVDHIIAPTLGGTNDKSNLQILTKEENRAKGVFETYLYKEVKAGRMTIKEAREKDLNWREEILNMPEGEIKTLSNDIQRNATSEDSLSGLVFKVVSDSGTPAMVDIGSEIEQPEYTGQAELDKKLKSAYKTSLTKRITDIVKVYESGQITAEEAEKLIAEIKQKQGKSGGGSGKIKVGTLPTFKAPTIKIKSSIPKVAINSSGIKISIPKTSQSKIKLPTFKKANLANKTVKVKQFRQPVVKIKNG